MAATVTIAGKQYPKSYLYIGAAATAGIVGYAWWTKGGGFGEEDEALPMFDEFGNPIAGPSPLATPPTVLDSNREFDDRTGFVTNADWSQFAISHLQGLGLDGPTVSSAIGKFLQRKPLIPVEADLVGQAVAVAGWPPEERPWTIIPVTTTTPPIAVGVAAPANFKAVGSAGKAVLSWDAVTGAASYETRLRGFAWVNRGNVTSHDVPFPANANATYTFEARAVNSAGAQGPISTATAKVTPSSTGGGGRVPLTVSGGGRTRTSITFRWNAVPGARYHIWRELGGRKLAAISVRGTSYTWRGLQPNHQYAVTVVALDRTNKEVSTRSRRVEKTLP